MKVTHTFLTLLFLTLFCSLPAYAHHVAVVVPVGNHSGAISSAELRKLLKSETRKWPDGDTVVVVVNRNSAVSMETLEHLCNLPAGEGTSFIAAHKSAFVLVESDAELLRVVSGTSGAIGLVDVRSINGQVHVLKVDGKLPMEKGYLPH